MARVISKQTGKAIVANVDYKYSPTVGLQYLSCYVALILVLLTIAYLIMTMHVFSMNTAGGNISRAYVGSLARYIILYLASTPAHPSL